MPASNQTTDPPTNDLTDESADQLRQLVAGQQNAVEKAEDELKALMANPDEEVVLRCVDM